jgi:hypothetical protein
MSAPSLNVPEKRLRLPQFGLRTLFLITAACGACFAVLGAIGFLASVGLIVVISIVCLHVLGNVLGRNLREQASADFSNDRSQLRPIGERLPVPIGADVHSRLFEHTSVGWTMRIFCVVGALTGGTLGAEALLIWDANRLPGIVLGAISSGVVGAFFGFLIGSFLEMALRAWWQASSEPRPTKPPMVLVPAGSLPSLNIDVSPPGADSTTYNV